MFIKQRPSTLLRRPNRILKVTRARLMNSFTSQLHHIRCPFLNSISRLRLGMLLHQFTNLLLCRITRVINQRIRLFHTPTCQERPITLKHITFRVIIRRPFRSKRHIFISLTTHSRLPFMRTCTMIRRRFSIQSSRPSTILISNIIRFTHCIL